MSASTTTSAEKARTRLLNVRESELQVREKAERNAEKRARSERVARIADCERQVNSWAKGLGKPFAVKTDASFLRDVVKVTLTVIPGVIFRVDLILGVTTEVEAYLNFEAMDGGLRKNLGGHATIADAVQAADALARAVLRLNLSDVMVLANMMDDE